MKYRIKLIRRAKCMTQEELVAAAKVARSIVARLETDENQNTTVDTLERIAAALGCTVADLLDEPTRNPQGVTVEVQVEGITRAMEQVDALCEKLEKAKSLADDLASRGSFEI